MSDILSKDLQVELAEAIQRSKAKASRMRVTSGGRTFTILRYWGNGFAVDASDAPHVRGLVDIFDGTRHLSNGLVVAAQAGPGEMAFEFKRATPHRDRPAVDYERDEAPPLALLPGE